MKRLGPIAPVTRVLLAANGVLAMIVTVQLTYPAGPRTVDPGAEMGTADLLPDFGAADFVPPPLANLSTMLDRPLFYTDRRMPAPPEDAAPPPTPLRLKLEGIAISGGSRVAILRNLANNQLVQVEEGGQHEGWTLDAMTSTSARFSRGPQVTELPLEPAPNTRR
jgi:hypothetical protein